MSKKLAILGASYLQEPLVQKAKEMGIYTICFAWEEGAVCRDICDKYFPISIIEKEEILEICKKENIDGIISIATDVAVPTMSFVALEMGLTGNSIHSSELCTNKFLMRKAFDQNGMTIPRFVSISGRKEIKKAKSLSFPLIAKPVDRSGSLGINLVREYNQLDAALYNALKSSFIHQAIVEEYIQGKEISIETISWQGEHHILAYTDKVTSGYPHFVELEHHQPSQLVDEFNKNQIDEILIKSLYVHDILNGASHTELLITESGEIFITEVGARMGGDFIGSDLVWISTGYDFLAGLINTALGKFKEPEIIRKGASGVYFITQRNKLVKAFISSGDKRIYKSEINKIPATKLTQSADRRGYFIYSSSQKIEIP